VLSESKLLITNEVASLSMVREEKVRLTGGVVDTVSAEQDVCG
jgi:hypothetical protein